MTTVIASLSVAGDDHGRRATPVPSDTSITQNRQADRPDPSGNSPSAQLSNTAHIAESDGAVPERPVCAASAGDMSAQSCDL